MGALAAAGWAGFARGETLWWEVGGAGWARLLHGKLLAVCVDWGLSIFN